MNPPALVNRWIALAATLAAAAVALAAAFSAGAAAQPGPGAAPLVFFGDRNLPPWESLQGNEPRGASIDLARAIGRELGRPVEVRLYEWSEAQRRLQAGEGHALTQLGRSAERERLYEFSRPAFATSVALFVPASGADGWNMDELAGKRIGVTGGGLPRQLLSERAPRAQLIVVANLREGTDLLLRGKLDALAAPSWAQLHLLHEMSISSISQLPPFHYTTTSVAVRKGDTALLAQIDTAIARLEARGEIARILDAWAPQRVFLFSAANLRTLQLVAGALVLALLALAVATALLIGQRRRLKREVAVRRAAEQQSRSDEERLHRLQSLTAALGRAVLPADVGTVLLQHGRTITGASHCQLLEYDVLDRVWRSLASDGFEAAATAEPLAHVEADTPSPLKALLDYRRPWHAADPAELASLDAGLALRVHYGGDFSSQQAIHASPLSLSAGSGANQPPIGALLLGWATPHTMDTAELARLEVVAKLFAQTLERTGLRGAERRALARQQALGGLAAALAGADSVGEVGWAACTAALRALDALNASMALFDSAHPPGRVPAGTALVMLESSRLPRSVTGHFGRFAVDSGLPLARAAWSALPVHLGDRAALEREVPELRGVDGLAEVQASAAVPLLLGPAAADDGAPPLAGACLGAMALDFDKPRLLDREERPFLAALAEMAARAVERCRLLAASQRERDNELRLRLAVESTGLGTWDVDLRAGTVHWNAGMYKLLGLPEGDGHETVARFMDLVLDEDRPRVEAEMARALRERSDFDVAFRVRRGDGPPRWLAGRGHVLQPAGAGDEPRRMIGVNYGITPMPQAPADEPAPAISPLRTP